MRLTLRTLLAWRDGLVHGPEHDDLAAKVASSTVAPRLVERMAELGARADLASPSSDANTVAEFLDNTLPADQLEVFERVCLESEMQFAEAAECHSLLAELLRDAKASSTLDPSSIEQLLAVATRQGSLPGDRSQPGDQVAIGDLMRQAKAVAARSTPRPATPGANGSLGAWLSVGAALLLLVVLGALLVRSIWLPETRNRQVAVAEQADIPRKPEQVVAEPVAPSPPPTVMEAPVSIPEPAPETRAASEPSAQTVSSEASGASPFPPENDVAVATGQTPTEPIIPLPVMEAPETGPEEPVPVGPVVPQPEPQAGHQPRLVAGGPLLHRVGIGEGDGWRAVFPGSSLAATEDFVVPIHSYPQIVCGDVSFRLLPGTRGVLAHGRDENVWIEIVFGKAVAWTEAASASVGMTAGGLSGVFTIGPRQPVGIEVDLARDRGTDPTVVPPGMRTSIVATGGGRFRQSQRDGSAPVAVLAGLELDQPVPPRGGMMWDSVAAGAARVAPLVQEPAWMKQAGPARTIDRHAAEALATVLAGDVPATDALRMAGDSRRVEVRMAAAATLALAGEYELLVELLCDESSGKKLRDGEWTALEAMTVPHALARGANATAALRQALATKGPPGREAELFLLARGMSAEELAAGGAAGLVKALEDPTLVVRRYALANLVSQLPDPAEATRNYRPDRAMLLNDKGIAWWRGQVEEGSRGSADAGKTP